MYPGARAVRTPDKIAAVMTGTGESIIYAELERRLRAIEEHKVTHTQFVPTMFVGMLQLPDQERGSCDVSSLRTAVHAGAPCPVEVKQRMIDWWGPVLVEHYESRPRPNRSPHSHRCFGPSTDLSPCDSARQRRRSRGMIVATVIW